LPIERTTVWGENLQPDSDIDGEGVRRAIQS